MNYIEWLRVRNCLRAVAIVLGVCLLLAVVLRISLSRYMMSDAWIQHMTLDPGTKVSHTILPDGTKRTFLDDSSERTQVIIDDHGYAGKRIVITEPTSRAHKEQRDVALGSIHVVASRNGATTTTVIDTNGAVPFFYYMGVADLMALIVAMVLAAPFAREVQGHLEVALTKPVPRMRYAVGSIGADIAGILAASLLTIIALYLCQLLFEPGRIDFSGISARAVAMGIAAPLAWYALLCALTTWLNRSYVAVLVAALPVIIVVGLLTLLDPSNAVARVVHDAAWYLSRLDPWTYVEFHIEDNSSGASTFGLRLGVQVLLFVIYSAIAIWQWQRVEA